MGISESATRVFRVYAVQVQLGKDTKVLVTLPLYSSFHYICNVPIFVV